MAKNNILGVTAAITARSMIYASAIPVAFVTAGTRAALKDSRSFSKTFSKTFAEMTRTNVATDTTNGFRNDFNQFMRETSLNIPVVAPITLDPKLRQAIAHTQLSKVVANLTVYLRNFFSDVKYTSQEEMQNTLRKLLLTEAALPALYPPNSVVIPNVSGRSSTGNSTSTGTDKTVTVKGVDNSDVNSFVSKNQWVGKAAWESDFAFVNISFNNIDGEERTYRLPVRVTVISVPPEEIVEVISSNLAVSSFLRRFGSLLKGNITVSQYILNTGHQNLMNSLSKVAGFNWADHIKRTKVGASLLIDSEMAAFLKERRGINIYSPRDLEKVLKACGIFDLFVVDEDANLLDVSGVTTDYRFKNFPLTQVYQTSKVTNDNSTIAIQLNH